MKPPLSLLIILGVLLATGASAYSVSVYYSFDNATITNGSIGDLAGAHNGSFVGNYTIVLGVYGEQVLFNGSAAVTGFSPEYLQSSWMCAWYEPIAEPIDRTVFSGFNSNYELYAGNWSPSYYCSGDEWCLVLYTSAFFVAMGTTPVQPGREDFICTNYVAGTGGLLWVNGVLEGNVTGTGALNETGELWLGAPFGVAAVDEFAFGYGVLSDSDVRDIMDGGLKGSFAVNTTLSAGESLSAARGESLLATTVCPGVLATLTMREAGSNATLFSAPMSLMGPSVYGANVTFPHEGNYFVTKTCLGDDLVAHRVIDDVTVTEPWTSFLFPLLGILCLLFGYKRRVLLFFAGVCFLLTVLFVPLPVLFIFILVLLSIGLFFEAARMHKEKKG